MQKTNINDFVSGRTSEFTGYYLGYNVDVKQGVLDGERKYKGVAVKAGTNKPFQQCISATKDKAVKRIFRLLEDRAK